MTEQNKLAIVAWAAKENGHFGNAATFNPLNSSWEDVVSQPINSHNVQAYSSYENGLHFTIKTLTNTVPGSGDVYARIRNALAAGNDSRAVLDAVAVTPWGTGAIQDSFLAMAKGEMK